MDVQRGYANTHGTPRSCGVFFNLPARDYLLVIPASSSLIGGTVDNEFEVILKK